MKIPNKINSGQKIQAEQYNAIVDTLRALVVSAGKGITLAQTSAGTTISILEETVAGGGGGFGGSGLSNAPRAIPIKIVSGTGTDHVGDIYENGSESTATDTSVAIKVLEINADASIPAHTWLMGFGMYWGTEGNEDLEWTVEVPRWL